MQRIFTIGILSLTLLGGVWGIAVPVTHAVSVDGSSPPTVNSAPAPAASGTASPAGGTQIQTPPPGDGSGIPVNGKPGATEEAYDSIMASIMSLFAWLVGVSAIVLDYAVFYTVVKGGALVGADSNSALSAIGVAWRILRDIGNIVLIFGFLAVGITVILDVNWYGVWTKMIPRLLLAAIFINFSFFISGAVISAGNLFATQFYTQINGGVAAGTKPPSLDGVSKEGISTKIMAQLGLQTLYNVDRNTDIFKNGNMWVVGFMGIILFLVTAFVMFSLAIILIARFVALIFLIIVAPVGFAGFAVPKLEGLASKWWKTLVEQTITAPILLLLLYVALAVITDNSFLRGFGVPPNASWLDVLKVDRGTDIGNFAGVVLSFLIAIGLLLAVTIAAKQLSAFGASTATKWGSKLTFGLTAATAGAGGRYTAGWATTRMASGLRKTRFARSETGRMVLGGLDRAGKSTYDFRNAAVAKSLGGTYLAKEGGVHFGTGIKEGFSESEKKGIKAREEYAKTLEVSQREKIQQNKLKETKADTEKKQKQLIAELDTRHLAEREPLENSIKEQRARVAQLRTKVTAGGAAADKKELETAKKELQTAELGLNNDLRQIEGIKQKQSQIRKEMEGVHKEVIEGMQQRIDAIDRAPKEQYAKNLRTGIKAVLKRNWTAGENIEKSAGKSKNQAALDAIQAAIDSGAKAEGKTSAPKVGDVDAKEDDKH